jgi:hypothetical protein
MGGEWPAYSKLAPYDGIGPLVFYVLKPEVYQIIWIIKATSQPFCLALFVETLLQLGPERGMVTQESLPGSPCLI